MTARVHCPVCHKELPIDFFECSQCGCANPQLHLIKRTAVTVMIDNAVMQPLTKISIREGKPLDDLVTQAVEYWLSELNAKKTKVY